MKPEQFIQFLDHPETIDLDALGILDQVVRQYPFCQPVQVLFLKSLQLSGGARFSNQLKIAAMYAGSRRALFELLNLGNKESEQPEDDSGQAKTREAPIPVLLDFEPAGIAPYPFIGPDLSKSPFKEPLPRDNEEIKTDLIEFDFGELAGAATPVHQPEPSRRRPQADLIDRFIESGGARIIRPDQVPVTEEDLSLNSLGENEEILTETLARIYIQQGYFAKAIHAYQKLSLKFPEKSIYFANQIEQVRELIKNQ